MHRQELQVLQQNESTHKISFLFYFQFFIAKTWLCEDTYEMLYTLDILWIEAGQLLSKHGYEKTIHLLLLTLGTVCWSVLTLWEVHCKWTERYESLTWISNVYLIVCL